MKKFFSKIGIEVECHLVNVLDKPVDIEDLPDLKKDFIQYLDQHQLPTFSLEPQISLIEFKTNPWLERDRLFRDIDAIYKLRYIAQAHNHDLLFMGMNPHTTSKDVLATRKPLPFGNFFSLAATHINIGIPETYEDRFFNILDYLQQWCLPFCTLMQSSPILANEVSGNQSARQMFISGMFGHHYDFYPKSLMSWDHVNKYIQLLNQSDNQYFIHHGLTNHLQHCVRPKKINGNTIIEFRYFDTSHINALKATIDLINETLVGIMAQLKSGKDLLLYKDVMFARMTMHQIDQIGRHAMVCLDLDHAFTLSEWSEQYLARINPEAHSQFMQALEKPTFSEILLQEHSPENQMKKMHL